MHYFRLFRVSRRFNDGCSVPLRSNFEKFRASIWPAWLERSYCDFAAYESVETDTEGALSERASSVSGKTKKSKRSVTRKKSVVDFRNIDAGLLPTVVLVGRPNVGKSALFNRFIGKREALVYNTPADHVTRDFREGIAKLGDLRFKVLDSAGLETAATSGSILSRTAGMTCNVLRRCQFALFLIDVRDGLQPLDHEVGKWMRKNVAGIRIVLVMNKSESLDDLSGDLIAAAGDAQALGFGEPEAGLTRDSIRAEFKYEGRTVYLVDTAG